MITTTVSDSAAVRMGRRRRDAVPAHPVGPVHPRGSRARVLLSSVFGPYAQDDEYGSRKMNPMELYENQVTREQGAFSLRMFHRSWGIMLIQANIGAPTTLLDFPDLERFTAEITENAYDIIGITSIIPNVEKVRKMCELIREHQPSATIVIGGHVANLPDLHERVSADHVVRGEGVRWMRRFLGEDTSQSIRHPRILSGINGHTMGLKLSDGPGDTAAALIPSVGCPMGCNFCSTSAMFGGKGNFLHFYETGDELFDVMCGLEKDLQTKAFFVMDENFLMHRKRALRLLDLMIEHDKSWAIYVFSSPNVLRSYTIDQIVGLGVSWLWMGLEGEDASYAKLKNVDTFELVRTLQSHGVRVLGSTIIGLENHTPENIDRVIQHAVSHDTEFHQFMLYTPIPGTPLYEEHKAAGTLVELDEVGYPDSHGQYRFRHKHPHIKDGQETEMLRGAFRADFETNGPSVIRVARTSLLGYQRYKNHPDPRIRERFRWEARDLPYTYAAALWVARYRFRDNPAVHAKVTDILNDYYREFGWKTRLVTPLAGRFVRYMMKRQERRMKNGLRFEPPTFRETRNLVAAAV